MTDSKLLTILTIACAVFSVSAIVILIDASFQIARPGSPSQASKRNLGITGRVILLHEESNGKLPQGTTFGEFGQIRHGWLMQVTPFMERKDIYDRCDFDRAWNDPVNVSLMKERIPLLINPALEDAPRKYENEYGLTHDVANSRIIGPYPAKTLDAITDGASNTIMVGEINRDFLPWGHPQNYRDPAIGLDVHNGFGGGSEYRTQFLFCDGSTRKINNDIDLAVLKALATPAAGDDARLSGGWR